MRASAGDRAAGVEGSGDHRWRYRVAALRELASFVTYLLSDEAAFITGAALAIDGGATA
jgi:NAD(P)-dependent dehydrogenase (short-subunit alcohol dehydrogenase family)